jgi:hypothetical protein
MKYEACRRMAPVLQAREMASRNLHTAQVTGSIPVAPTPIAQSGVWNWPTSPLEGAAVLESVSVLVSPRGPGLVAPGSRMISTEPGPRLGRERLRNGGNRCEPVRDENPCAAWISAVYPKLREPLLMTTDQEVGDSSSSGRAAETPAMRGFRRVNSATVEDMTPDFWVVSWSVVSALPTSRVWWLAVKGSDVQLPSAPRER